MKRNIKILGIEYALPSNIFYFGKQRRYRINDKESQLSLAVNATKKVLEATNTKISDIDLIVSCSAVPYQLIPNMSSLIYENFNDGRGIPCIDINTTCTSYITALDIISYMLSDEKYSKILVVSSDVPSKALNPDDKETYELFSDCAVATIVGKCKDESGIIYSSQKTFPQAAHDTEIIAGGTRCTSFELTEENKKLYYFKMNGINAIRLVLSEINNVYNDVLKCVPDIDYIVPHQASRILDVLLKRANIDRPYINIVREYGNMVSSSVPFALKKAIERGNIKRGEKVLLIGTAAGLTINTLVLQY